MLLESETSSTHVLYQKFAQTPPHHPLPWTIGKPKYRHQARYKNRLMDHDSPNSTIFSSMRPQRYDVCVGNVHTKQKRYHRQERWHPCKLSRSVEEAFGTNICWPSSWIRRAHAQITLRSRHRHGKRKTESWPQNAEECQRMKTPNHSVTPNYAILRSAMVMIDARRHWTVQNRWNKSIRRERTRAIELEKSKSCLQSCQYQRIRNIGKKKKEWKEEGRKERKIIRKTDRKKGRKNGLKWKFLKKVIWKQTTN